MKFPTSSATTPRVARQLPADPPRFPHPRRSAEVSDTPAGSPARSTTPRASRDGPMEPRPSTSSPPSTAIRPTGHLSERRSPSRRGRRSSTRRRRATGSSRRSRGVSWTSRRSRPSSPSPRTRALEEEEASWTGDCARRDDARAKGGGTAVREGATATCARGRDVGENYELENDQGSYASSAGVTTVPGESSANSDVVSFGAAAREEQDLSGFDSDSGATSEKRSRRRVRVSGSFRSATEVGRNCCRR